MLFEYKSDAVVRIVNSPDHPTKNTPLHYATALEGGQVVNILLDHGADRSLFKLNCQGQMPLNMISTDALRSILDFQIKPEGLAGVTGLSNHLKLVLRNDLFFQHLSPTCEEIQEQRANLTQTLVINNRVELPSLAAADYFSPNGDFKVAELDKVRNRNTYQDILKRPFSHSDIIVQVAQLKDKHEDLFDHPVVASLIWAKWQKVRSVFALSSSLKVIQHIFGILYVFTTYSGLGFPLFHPEAGNCTILGTNETTTTDFCDVVCCPRRLSDSFLTLVLIFWGLNVTRKAFEVFSLFTKSTSKNVSFVSVVCANLKTWISQSENIMAVLINLVFVPYMCLVPYSESHRDVAGKQVFFLSLRFHIFFILFL